MSEKHEEHGAIFVTDTEAAICINVERVDEPELWIPFSQIDKIVKHKNGTCDIVMTEWIARKKGLV